MWYFPLFLFRLPFRLFPTEGICVDYLQAIRNL